MAEGEHHDNHVAAGEKLPTKWCSRWTTWQPLESRWTNGNPTVQQVNNMATIWQPRRSRWKKWQPNVSAGEQHENQVATEVNKMATPMWQQMSNRTTTRYQSLVNKMATPRGSRWTKLQPRGTSNPRTITGSFGGELIGRSQVNRKPHLNIIMNNLLHIYWEQQQIS